MTKKLFIAFASHVREMRLKALQLESTDIVAAQRDYTSASAICDAFCRIAKQSNVKFDENKFRKACAI